QLPLFSLIVPAWLVWTMSGWRGVRGVWPAVLVSGGTFAVVQFWVSNWFGPRLVDVAGGLVSLISLAVFLKLWRPAPTWSLDAQHQEPSSSQAPVTTHTTSEVVSAWVPWVLLSVCVFVWGLPQVRTFFDGGLTSAAIRARAEKSGTREAELKWWERPNVLAGI